MADGRRNEVRLAQLRGELDAFERELEAWLKKRRDADPQQQYHSQLAAIDAVLTASARFLREQFTETEARASGDSGDFFAACEVHDLRVLWMRQVLMFYQQRFDQRDDAEMRRLLQAADEVVWACYAPVRKRLKDQVGKIVDAPAPLPFLDMVYSPVAIPVKWIPDDLSEHAGALPQFLQRMPVPIIGLPTACLRSPWWLVLIAHEVGHHVQISAGLDATFSDLCKEVAKACGAEPAEWAGWSREVFADLYSVALLGASAARAIVEFERRPKNEMATRRQRYPPPAVRLSLLGHAVEFLQVRIGGFDPLGGINPNEFLVGANRSNDQKVIEALVPAAFDGSGPASALPIGLRKLCVPDTVGLSRLSGLDADGMTPRAVLRFVNAQVVQWDTIVREASDGTLNTRLESLRVQVPRGIVARKENGTRAARDSVLDIETGELVKRLFAAATPPPPAL